MASNDGEGESKAEEKNDVEEVIFEEGAIVEANDAGTLDDGVFIYLIL